MTVRRLLSSCLLCALAAGGEAQAEPLLAKLKEAPATDAGRAASEQRQRARSSQLRLTLALQRPQADPGIRGSVLTGFYVSDLLTRTRGTEDDRNNFSGIVGMRSSGFITYAERGVTFARTDRTHLDAALGGGGAGFHGRFVADPGVGLRLAAGPEHGPLARLSLRAWLEGNEAFSLALLELPGAEVGYQYLGGPLLVELAGRAGIALAGHYRAGEAEARKLGESWTWGSHLAFVLDSVQFKAEFVRIEAQDDPVDIFKASICGVADWLLLCTQLDRYAARARWQAGGVEHFDDTSAVVAGFRIGIGSHVRGRMPIER